MGGIVSVHSLIHKYSEIAAYQKNCTLLHGNLIKVLAIIIPTMAKIWHLRIWNEVPKIASKLVEVVMRYVHLFKKLTI